MASSLPRYIAGVPCWLELRTPDPAAAAAFWAAALGWDVDAPDAAGLRVARIEGEVVAGLAPADEVAWSTAIAVDDVAAAVATVRAAGGEAEPAADGRTAACRDPRGAAFALRAVDAQPQAERVNASGSWNWSDLATGDREVAVEFYERVMGWEATEVAFGPEPATMWRRPGYGDHLATRDPSLRERHSADGVPPGFSDAIGWLLATEAGEPDAWRVTFAVDDVDGVVDRVTAHGGHVVVAPFAAGPARLATVADPAGAVCTLSHYQPG